MGSVSRTNNEDSTRGWEDSELRARLNDGENSLYQQMFTESEWAAIQLTTLENTIHVGTQEVARGDDTQDYLFLLSKDEVEWYKQQLPPETMDEHEDGWRHFGKWWTRTAATLEDVKANYFGSAENCNGYMLVVAKPYFDYDYYAEAVDNEHQEVLPAMWVNAESLLKAWQE